MRVAIARQAVATAAAIEVEPGARVVDGAAQRVTRRINRLTRRQRSRTAVAQTIVTRTARFARARSFSGGAAATAAGRRAAGIARACARAGAARGARARTYRATRAVSQHVGMAARAARGSQRSRDRCGNEPMNCAAPRARPANADRIAHRPFRSPEGPTTRARVELRSARRNSTQSSTLPPFCAPASHAHRVRPTRYVAGRLPVLPKQSDARRAAR